MAQLPSALVCQAANPSCTTSPERCTAKSRMVVVPPWAAATVPVLAGCDAISHNDTAVEVLRSAEGLSNSVHRALGRRAMAQEFKPADIAPKFRANGTTMPMGEEYAAMVANGLRRGSAFTTAATLGRWCDLLATLDARLS